MNIRRQRALRRMINRSRSPAAHMVILVLVAAAGLFFAAR